MMLIGLLIGLCLAGAWLALVLEWRSHRGSRPAINREASEGRPWAHVEAGPDSLYLPGTGRSETSDKDLNKK
jgi:hypothetical protein